MSGFQMESLDADLPPEGWLGDPDEWPTLFFRNKLRKWPYLTKEDLESGWIGQTVHHTVLCFVCVEDEGWDDLSWELLSALPDMGRAGDKMTWLEYETQINDPGTFWEMVREALGGSSAYPLSSETPNADWALQNGICPGQWFILKLTPNYVTYPASPNSPEEYDFEIDAELMDMEKLDSSDHFGRWKDFFFTTKLDDGLPRFQASSFFLTD